ncbi:hypothetical protein GCM10009565_49060 [Amycolatopsis albidoflavus]
MARVTIGQSGNQGAPTHRFSRARRFSQIKLKVVTPMTTMTIEMSDPTTPAAKWDTDLVGYRVRAAATLIRHQSLDGRCADCGAAAPCPAARAAEMVLEL